MIQLRFRTQFSVLTEQKDPDLYISNILSSVSARDNWEIPSVLRVSGLFVFS